MESLGMIKEMIRSVPSLPMALKILLLSRWPLDLLAISLQ